MLVARREEQLRELAGEIDGEVEVCDVSDREAVDALAARVRERHPALGLLVNNAGVGARGDFLTSEPERIEQVIRTNYLGSVWCLRAFLPALEAGTPSHVVNIVSVAGTVALGSSGPYAASKHAQLAFLAFNRGAAAPARRARPHGETGLRRDAGLPAARALAQSRLAADRDRAGRRRAARLEVLASGKVETTVPRWYRVASILQALSPALLVRALGRRRAG